jgi:hypothetical protein
MAIRHKQDRAATAPDRQTTEQKALERKADERLVKRAAEKATESLREKIVVALLGFVLTGIVGTVLTTWIQQRGWAWQNRVSRIEKDTESAIQTYRASSELINSRWHATYRIARSLERKQKGDDWDKTREAFESADREWALKYTNVAREIDFYIDTPFGVESQKLLAPVWSFECGEYAFGAGSASRFDTTSARVVMELINHCHGRTKEDIDRLMETREAVSDEKRKETIDLTMRRLDHLYKTNETLRCVIFDRVLDIRRAASGESYWGTFFGISEIGYQRSAEKRPCLR